MATPKPAAPKPPTVPVTQNPESQMAQLKQQELNLGESQLQQQNQYTEFYQGKEYAQADQFAKQQLGLSLADIYAQINQQKHELPLTLQGIASQAGSSGNFFSGARKQAQGEATYQEQQAVGSLGRAAQGQKLSYSQQIEREKLAMQKLKAGDILGYQQLKAQDKLKSQQISLEGQKHLSISDIQNAMYNGAITPEDAMKRLEAMGYSAGDAKLIVGGYTSKGGGGKNLSVSEIQKAVKDGLMSPADATKYLEGLGYSPDETNILMQEGGGTTGGVPAGLSGIYYLKGKDKTGKAFSYDISVGRGERITEGMANHMRNAPVYTDMANAMDLYFKDAAASGQKPKLADLATYIKDHTNPAETLGPDEFARYMSLVLSDYYMSSTATPGIDV